ncbi:MAG: flippase activity-associated protein Agl23 [Dehalococcoidia bacterium]
MSEATADAPAQEEERFTLLDRLRAIDAVEWTVIALFAASLVLHLWDVGARAQHHDESQHAAFSYYFASGSGYRHDPLLHGPLQFHVMALIFKLFGDSDFTSRVFHAVMGSVLVMTPLWFRRTLGGPGVVLAALFLVISPSLLYYSRFARNDIPVIVFTVMIIAGTWRYRSDRRLRWLLLVSGGMALSFASKETTYIAAAVLLLYLNGALAHALFMQQRRGTRPTFLDRLADGVWLFPTAWVFAALWEPLAPLRRRLGLHERPPEADVLVVVGTLVLPLLAAFARLPLHLVGVEVAGPGHTMLATAVVVALLVASTGVGALWRWDWWVACAAVFFAITVPLYMSMGTNVDGIGGLFWNSLSYWLDQQEVRRGTQPWFYYLMMVPLYEMLVLLPAVVGGTWLALRRQDHFAALLLWWFTGTLLALSYAGEKMPWLTTHLALPLVFLAAYVLGRALPVAAVHVREGTGSVLAWAGGGLAVATMGLALVVTLRADIGLNARHPDTPVEPLIYVQTTPEVPRLAAEIRQWVAEGRAGSIVLDDSEAAGITWPWAWYLRHEGLTYTTADQVLADGNTRAIVIRTRGERAAPQALVERSSDVVVYRHRWWYPEEGYRGTTWAELGAGLRDGSLLREWAAFVWDRGDRDQIASLDGEVFFPR